MHTYNYRTSAKEEGVPGGYDAPSCTPTPPLINAFSI